MRVEPTDAERLLWFLLRKRRFEGLRFRRQQPFGPYILDFYCPKLRIAVEVDGGGHAEERAEEYDARRTEFLEANGIVVVRYWNHDVLQQTEVVLEDLYRRVHARGGERGVGEGFGQCDGTDRRFVR